MNCGHRVGCPAHPPAKGHSWRRRKTIGVWALFIIYGACFGVELTINNIAALYYYDRFELNLATAGIIAGLFGLMNIFARTLGGFFGDKMGIPVRIEGTGDISGRLYC